MFIADSIRNPVFVIDEGSKIFSVKDKKGVVEYLTSPKDSGEEEKLKKYLKEKTDGRE